MAPSAGNETRGRDSRCEGKLDDATAARALETIERSAKTEARLIEDMLDVSRVIGGKISLALRPVNLATLMAETIETVRPAIDKKAIRVEMDVRQVVDGISADPDRLRQVLENLLVNAIKFTPEGGEIIVRLDRNAQCATIAVCDSGRGIRADLLPHVFKQFWQGDPAATHLGGLGLGLGIVERLVELHGETIEATSDGEGRGATFTVTLPTHLRDRVECREVPARPSVVAYATQALDDHGSRPVFSPVKKQAAKRSGDDGGLARCLPPCPPVVADVASGVHAQALRQSVPTVRADP